MRVFDPLRKPDVATTHRAVVPPLLPTLGLALVAALLSLTCREPAKDAPSPNRPVSVQALPVMASADRLSVFDPGKALLADLDPVPASEAFARLAPPVVASDAPARPARQPMMAKSERRRPPASRVATTQTPPAAPSKPVAEPFERSTASEAEDQRFLPAGALPFAAVDAAWDAARSAGAGAVSLGGSVVSLVSALR